jgi:class 3 adenylate cyclase/tetratricopeptide (TPR) repeat protein
MNALLPRRLTAVLYADVAEYSRLTADDEDSTHRLLSESLDLFAALISAWRGRVIHYAGDAILAEFPTASDALSCSQVVQRKFATRNESLPPDARMAFRIGINVGEVIEDREDVYGAGVNVAARLESLCDVGGVCVSEAVRSAVAGRRVYSFDDLGLHEVKNLPEPLHAFTVRMSDETHLQRECVVLRAEPRSAGILFDDNRVRARNSLDRARACVSDAIEEAGGHIADTPGETLVAVLEDWPAALDCARSARDALESLNPTLPIEEQVVFRFGLDFGDCNQDESGPCGDGVIGASHLVDTAGSNEVMSAKEVTETDATFVPCGDGKFAVDQASSEYDVPLQVDGFEFPRPEKPSIVTVPFATPEGDVESASLGVGIRMGIQNALVRLSGLFAVASGATPPVQHLPIDEIARRFGVRYVLDGSVQCAGERARVYVQLHDMDSGTVVWSERYDRVLDDAFAVQDDIVDHIITALDVKLATGEQARLWREWVKRPDAREALYRGFHAFWQMNAESMNTALRRFERSAKLEPAASIAGSMAAMALWFIATRGWTDDPLEARRRAGEWARRVAEMEDVDGQAHTVLGNVLLLEGRHDEALKVARHAVEIRPGCTNANGFCANVLLYCGESEEAGERARNAIRISPVYAPWFVEVLSGAYRDSGNLSFALSAAREAIRLTPGAVNARALLASTLVRAGWTAEAASVGKEILDLEPTFTLASFRASQPYRSTRTQDLIVEELSQAGIPA